MHSDAYFATGKTHAVCQDYAYASDVDGWPYAVVSDGCSSSPDTDIGARLLARPVMASAFVESSKIITAADCARKIIGLNQLCLDATLLLARMNENGGFSVIIYGDGYVVARDRETQNLGIVKIEYPSGAPPYISYQLDSQRYNAFCDEYGFKAITTSIIISDGNISTVEEEHEDMRCYVASYSSKNDIVAIFSDGIGTFNGISDIDAIQYLMSFKSMAGKFVQRRMKRFLKDRDSVSHNDDISMAAIYAE
jgi:hypothetical protein